MAQPARGSGAASVAVAASEPETAQARERNLASLAVERGYATAEQMQSALREHHAAGAQPNARHAVNDRQHRRELRSVDLQVRRQRTLRRHVLPRLKESKNQDVKNRYIDRFFPSRRNA